MILGNRECPYCEITVPVVEHVKQVENDPPMFEISHHCELCGKDIEIVGD